LNNRQSASYPMEVMQGLIGGKWNTLILWHLLPGKRRFSELKRLLPDITQKILIQRLRELEANGLIRRKVYAEVPPKVEYSMTSLGRSLEPVLNAMHSWGEAYINSMDERLV